MKAKLLFPIALAAGLILGFATPARASTVTGAYVIVASNETAQNTSDGNPLQITFDLTQGRGTVIVSNILSNSNCINADTISQQLVNPAVQINFQTATVQSLTFGSAVDGSVFTFTVAQHEDGVYTGTFSGTSGCASNDSGKFTAQLVTPPGARYFYSGMFSTDNAGTNVPNGFTGAPTSINFRVNFKFMMDGTTVQIRAPLCPGGPSPERLLVSPYADSIGGFQSIQSGNVLLFNASDNTNTITFIATPTGVDGNTDTPGNWDLTYYVDTGACAGYSGTGSPFRIDHNVPTKAAIEPIHPRFSGNVGLLR